MSASQAASTVATALPCAACKQPVIEKRSADGALVVLDAATKRLHLCVKRKESEALKARQMAQSRAEPRRPAKPLPPAKRVKETRPSDAPRPPRPPKPVRERVARPIRPARPAPTRAAEAARKPAPPRKPRPTTLRSPPQVEEILKGRVVRWRTGDGPTSFCAECSAPVLVGFSHVRWDVMMLDAAGHRPHDCETFRQAAAALRGATPARPAETPAVSVRVEPVRRVVRPAPPIVPVAPIAKVAPKPRRRPAGNSPLVAAANNCDTCGKLKAVRNGEWVCLHCGA